MKQPELTVRCIYSAQGETAAQILLHAFTLFLRRELGQVKEMPAYGLLPGH